MFFCFCSCLFFLCCLFPFIELICIILFLCCCFCHKTKWYSCLHLVVLLLFCFLLFCLIFFCFFIPLKKKTPQKTGHSKNPKMQKMQKKTDKKKDQLAQLCSQIVFFNFLGGLKNFHCLAENTIKIVVSALFQKGKKRPKINKIVELKIRPRLR